MTNERPIWLPAECVYYEGHKLREELLDRTNPHTLFVGYRLFTEQISLFVFDVGKPGVVVDLKLPTEEIEAIWGYCKNSSAERAAKELI